jgi:DNA polymerase III delta prime subunit
MALHNIEKVINKILLKNKIVHSSILIYGTSGVGKSSIVQIIITTLFGSFSSSDLMIISDKNDLDGVMKKNRSISIDEVRKAIEFSTTSSTGEYKILVFDGIDSMSISAVNSILKLVEEPLPGLYIFLITRNLYKIPKTLRSRCMKFFVEKPSLEDFKELFPAHPEELITYLYHVCDGDINTVSSFLETSDDALIEKVFNQEVSLEKLPEVKDESLDVIIKIILFEIKNNAIVNKSFIEKYNVITDRYKKIVNYNLSKTNVIFALSQLT